MLLASELQEKFQRMVFTHFWSFFIEHSGRNPKYPSCSLYCKDPYSIFFFFIFSYFYPFFVVLYTKLSPMPMVSNTGMGLIFVCCTGFSTGLKYITFRTHTYSHKNPRRERQNNPSYHATVVI